MLTKFSASSFVLGRGLFGFTLLWVMWCAPLNASEAPPPAAQVVQDQLKNESVGERVMPDARDWKLDESVFTELKPFTAPEQAIRLPEDQRE
ncbi:MAG: hypothetical protein AB8B93_04275 [Pseudomonadales bacterium]